MGRQALIFKESELARSPSKSVKTPSPQGTPNIPRYSTGGFQKAAQQTPVCWDLGPSPILPSLDQTGEILRCKKT